MSQVSDARIALLERLFDHAPLFPPASLPLEEAVREDERARASRSAFALGRFVCPASRLHELSDVGRGLTVVQDAPFEPDARVEAVEVPPGVPVVSAGAAREAYVEVTLDGTLEDALDELAEHGLHAKVRCGGASVPSTAELARFLRACRERGTAYKATAGLHHAVRRNGEHGFVNLLAAAVFGDEDAALAETEPSAFAVSAEGFTWRGQTAEATELAEARRSRLHAIGTCSFFEPVEELEALGILPL